MHIWGTLSIVPADQPPHPGEGVEVVKDVSGVPWARTKPATGMVTGCNALIQPPGMPVIVSLHPVCPLCHSTAQRELAQAMRRGPALTEPGAAARAARLSEASG